MSYIEVYVDDLAITSKDFKAIIGELTEKYKYNLNGVGPIKFQHCCDFSRYPDGTLVLDQEVISPG